MPKSKGKNKPHGSPATPAAAPAAALAVSQVPPSIESAYWGEAPRSTTAVAAGAAAAATAQVAGDHQGDIAHTSSSDHPSVLGVDADDAAASSSFRAPAAARRASPQAYAIDRPPAAVSPASQDNTSRSSPSKQLRVTPNLREITVARSLAAVQANDAAATAIAAANHCSEEVDKSARMKASAVIGAAAASEIAPPIQSVEAPGSATSASLCTRLSQATFASISCLLLSTFPSVCLTGSWRWTVLPQEANLLPRSRGCCAEQWAPTPQSNCSVSLRTAPLFLSKQLFCGCQYCLKNSGRQCTPSTMRLAKFLLRHKALLAPPRPQRRHRR